MFARISWSKLPAQTPFEDGVAQFRDRILPSLKTRDGFLGAVIIGNRETNDGIIGTYWASRDALNGSEAMGATARDESTRSSGVQLIDIDRFEVLLQDRAGPVEVGTFVRWNDAYMPPERIDNVLAVLRDRAVPASRALSGYRATLMFVNRATGRLALGTVWDSAAQREASESGVENFRREVLDAAGTLEAPRVTLWESVFAEVNAPAQAPVNVGAATA